MVVTARQKQVVQFLLGATLLASVFYESRMFWGSQLSHALFSLFNSPPRGIAGFILLTLPVSIVATLPFGVLYGLAYPSSQLSLATLFAFLAAAANVGLVVWIDVVHYPLPITHPFWLFFSFETLTFIALFPVFATLGARLRLRLNSSAQTILAIVTFVVLALVYYLGSIIYYQYIYRPGV